MRHAGSREILVFVEHGEQLVRIVEQQGVDAGVFHRPHDPTHEKVIIAGDTPLDLICDSTLLEIPTAINLAAKWLIVPFARPFGFANYYPELSLHPAGRSD